MNAAQTMEEVKLWYKEDCAGRGTVPEGAFSRAEEYARESGEDGYLTYLGTLRRLLGMG